MSIVDSFLESVQENSPSILMGLSIAGFVSATILAVTATKNALLTIENTELPSNQFEKIKTQVRILWPHYAPAIGATLISTALLLGSSRVSSKRYGAMATMYVATKNYLERLQEATLQEVGPKKYDKIENAAAAAKIDSQKVVFIEGDVTAYDTFSDRYVNIKNVETIRSAVNTLNETLFSDGFVPVNSFYDEIGLPHCAYGNDVGWSMENGAINIVLGSTLTNSRPVVTITFRVQPKHIYDKIYRN